MNLLSNGGRFTERAVFRFLFDKKGNNVEVTVADTGLGLRQPISESSSPFQQLDGSIRRRYEAPAGAEH